jgi:CBS domain-containing protein
LERFVDEDVTHLPVVDESGRLLGMCTRTDLLRAEARRPTAERTGSRLRTRGGTLAPRDGPRP